MTHVDDLHLIGYSIAVKDLVLEKSTVQRLELLEVKSLDGCIVIDVRHLLGCETRVYHDSCCLRLNWHGQPLKLLGSKHEDAVCMSTFVYKLVEVAIIFLEQG